jgi:type 1 glutamine amidotransferase
MGDHPLVWYQQIGKGVVFQSAFGHPDALYSDPVYRAHLAGAIEATARKEK